MRASAESSRLRIHLLGRFQVSLDAQPIPRDAWRLRKAATIVKLLALAPAHRLHREQVLDSLWPDLDVRAAANNLYHTLHVTRGILSPHGSTLRLEKDQIFFQPADGLWID